MMSSAGTNTEFKRHPFYLGGIGGYGSTTWQGLVPTQENQNLAISISTPLEVKEGGGVWGFFGGYEFIPNFAIEANYMRYPDAQITFDPISIFSFTNEGITEFTTHTETVNVVGKFMLLLPNSKMRVFSSVGAASVHRKDILTDKWRLSPTFGAGFNFHFTERIMGELGANYTAGFGESRLNPTNSYFPFLYSITARFGYCFG
jgi:hypothetical protein